MKTATSSAWLLPVTTFERLLLPSGRIVDVAKATPSFSLWRGEQPPDRYGKKPVVDFDGRMAFAELAILWSLQKAGWNGLWVNTRSPLELPAGPKMLLDRISSLRGGKHRGTWDVFCWRDGEYLFAQSKWKNHDRFKPLQLEWLEAALSVNLPLSSFLIVEWSIQSAASQPWFAM